MCAVRGSTAPSSTTSSNREYQRFLQERNRGRGDSDGRPDRTPAEIQEWAADHDLPYFDGHVHFPDARVEYVDQDGRLDHGPISERPIARET